MFISIYRTRPRCVDMLRFVEIVQTETVSRERRLQEHGFRFLVSLLVNCLQDACTWQVIWSSTMGYWHSSIGLMETRKVREKVNFVARRVEARRLAEGST